MNLTDIKTHTKRRPVKMDLFTGILFAFQFCLRLFLLAKKTPITEDRRRNQENHNIAGEIRALGRSSTMIFRTGRAFPPLGYPSRAGQGPGSDTSSRDGSTRILGAPPGPLLALFGEDL